MSPVGCGRVRGFRGACGAGTVSGTAGRGGAGGGSGSPGGVGNFQPSVETVSVSLPSARTHGGSVNSRASRTLAVSGTSKRGSDLTATGNARSTTSTRKPSPPAGVGPSSGTLRHPHAAGLADRLADAGERLGHVQAAEPLEMFLDPRQLGREIR